MGGGRGRRRAAPRHRPASTARPRSPSRTPRPCPGCRRRAPDRYGSASLRADRSGAWSQERRGRNALEGQDPHGDDGHRCRGGEPRAAGGRPSGARIRLDVEEDQARRPRRSRRAQLPQEVTRTRNSASRGAPKPRASNTATACSRGQQAGDPAARRTANGRARSAGRPAPSRVASSQSAEQHESDDARQGRAYAGGASGGPGGATTPKLTNTASPGSAIGIACRPSACSQPPAATARAASLADPEGAGANRTATVGPTPSPGSKAVRKAGRTSTGGSRRAAAVGTRCTVKKPRAAPGLGEAPRQARPRPWWWVRNTGRRWRWAVPEDRDRLHPPLDERGPRWPRSAEQDRHPVAPGLDGRVRPADLRQTLVLGHVGCSRARWSCSGR
jgi:hypothetical protein